MPERDNMKVFVSWSRDLSKDVALALREWLPLIFDGIEVWASDSDIEAGERGLAKIESELSDTRFGIVVVTAENQEAPWLNFEAGALSRVVNDEEHRVVPLLVDLDSPASLTGPLSQFQAKMATEDGMRGLVRSIATVRGVERSLADARFEGFWPQFEPKVAAAKKNAKKPAAELVRRPLADVMDEVLLHVRALRSSPSGSERDERSDPRTEARRNLEVLAAPFNLEITRASWGADRLRVAMVRPINRRLEADLESFRDTLANSGPTFDAAVVTFEPGREPETESQDAMPEEPPWS